MRKIDAATLAALAARELVARDFIWIVAKDRTTGALAPAGFWSDLGTVTAPVVDGDTGLTVYRDFTGSGNLISMDDIPLVSDVSVRTINITLSQVSDQVAQLVRGYDVKGAPVQVHRGVFNPKSRALVAPALPRFLGFVDGAPIITPPASLDGSQPQDGSVTLIVASHTRELTRTNSAKRSDQDQRLRNPGDGFYKYVDVAGGWQLFWGQNAAKTASGQ